MKIIAAIQILIKLFTIGYGAGAVRTTGRFTARQAVMENGDFVRYIVIFRGSLFSFSYTFPTFIKILYDIFSAIIFYEAYFLHKHNIVINIPDSLTAYDRLYSITYHIKNVNKNIDKPLLFAYYYVTVLL